MSLQGSTVSMPSAPMMNSAAKPPQMASLQHAQPMAQQVLTRQRSRPEEVDEHIPLHWISEHCAPSSNPDPLQASHQGSSAQPFQLPRANLPNQRSGNPFAEPDEISESSQVQQTVQELPAGGQGWSAEANISEVYNTQPPATTQMQHGAHAQQQSKGRPSSYSAWDETNRTGLVRESHTGALQVSC